MERGPKREDEKLSTETGQLQDATMADESDATGSNRPGASLLVMDQLPVGSRSLLAVNWERASSNAVSLKAPLLRFFEGDARCEIWWLWVS